MKRTVLYFLCLVALAFPVASFAVQESASATVAATAIADNGLMQQKAEGDIDAVWSRLLAALKAIKAPIFSTVDHKANAVSVGLTMPGARVVTFGNPAVGTALMQAAPSAALDLPLRILVWESPEGVMLSWNDPAWIAARHGASPDLPVVGKMRGMLRKLAETAARPGK